MPCLAVREKRVVGSGNRQAGRDACAPGAALSKNDVRDLAEIDLLGRPILHLDY